MIQPADSTPSDGVGKAHDNPYGLEPDPIPSEWVLDGAPLARRKRMVGSSDGRSSTHMWDCTAGRFNWYYASDEVIHVVEGAVVVEDEAGLCRLLEAGDVFLFPAGSTFRWTVPLYIRKVAFLHDPLSRKLRLAQRLYRLVKAPFRRKSAPSAFTG